MLRKLYLVSPEYVDNNPRVPQRPQTKNYHNLSQLRARNMDAKKMQHPYDKWVKMLHKMQEANISRKPLIQKIADFLQKFYLAIRLLEP